MLPRRLAMIAVAALGVMLISFVGFALAWLQMRRTGAN